MSELKRIFVGGLVENITQEELRGRFSRFGEVTNIDLRVKGDATDSEKKRFAYVSMKITDDNLNKCVRLYNKTRWKGKELCLQVAKESFLERLQKERESAGKDTKVDNGSLESDDHDKIKNTIVKAAPQGTPVGNMRNWVVGKQGEILPVVYMRQKDKKKVIKIDPSKYIHHNKTLGNEAKGSVMEPVEKSVESLTWRLEEKQRSTAEQTAIGSNKKLKLLINKDTKTTASVHGCRSESGVLKKLGEPVVNQQPLSGTLDFISDSDDCAGDDGKVTGAYHSSSDDTDEMLSKLKTGNRSMKSATKIRFERERVLRNGTKLPKLKKSLLSNSAGNEDSGGSTSDTSTGIIEEPVTALPKWLESESETDSEKHDETTERGCVNQHSLSSPKRDKSKSGCVTSVAKNRVKPSLNKKQNTNAEGEMAFLLKMPPVSKQLTKSTVQSIDSDCTGGTGDSRRGTPNKFDYVKTVLDEYSSGFQELEPCIASSDSEELDVFEVIESGKVKKLYKNQPHTRKNNNDIEGKIGLRSPEFKTNSEKKPPVESIPLVKERLEGKKRQKVGTKTKVPCTAEKQKAANEKRLKSLRQRMLETQQQKSLIKQSLAEVDSQKSTNKKIVFDSDEEMDDVPVLPVDSQVMKPKDVSEGSSSDFSIDQKAANAKKTKSCALFASDSSDSSGSDDDAGNKSDEERFKIRPEFQGKAGRKLLHLQSKFGNDKRFKLDSRFIDSSTDTDSQSDHEEASHTDGDAVSEKGHALEILKSVVGSRVVSAKKQEKTFKDINELHYDPACEDHVQFEIPAKAKKKASKTVEKKSVVKSDQQKEETPELPPVTEEKFYEVETSLKDLFQKKQEEEPFSLMAAFGQHDAGDKTPVKDASVQEQTTVHNGAFPWQQPQACRDTSDEEDDDSDDNRADLANREAVCAHSTSTTSSKRNVFFIGLNDPEVQESLRFFTCPADEEEMRTKWLEARPGLVEAYKTKRKYSLREARSNKKVSKRGRQC